MSTKKRFTIYITEEEQWWIHDLARTNKTSAVKLIMDLLEGKSKELEIPLPKKRSKRRINNPHNQKTPNEFAYPKQKFMAKIDKELGL